MGTHLRCTRDGCKNRAWIPSAAMKKRDLLDNPRAVCHAPTPTRERCGALMVIE